MKITILGIDGLEKSIVDQYIDLLPNFKKISQEGLLSTIDSVFPADSVPAWNTIFTGLNPSEHGIIRGRDYIESYEDFKGSLTFQLEGNTFWDKLSNGGKKCLVINPYLAYPAWKVNGVMVSAPSFVEGPSTSYPENNEIKHPNCLGGYQGVENFSSLKRDMEKAYDDTVKLLDEYKYQSNKDDFDLEFLTVTTLDRIQHYTWRFFDKNDPLHEYDEYLSNLILNMLLLFDTLIGEIMSKMEGDDKIIIISDHGFGQRPYHLINLNEILRKEGLLKLKKSDSIGLKSSQKIKTKTLKVLSDLKIIDPVIKIAKVFPFLKKMKKSNHLIDIENSICYVDDFFNGKKPYCGLNFSTKIRNSSVLEQEKAYNDIVKFLNSGIIPKPKWICLSSDLYKGKYSSNYPDICFELPKDYGIEYELFGENQNKSVTHYKLSGGHLGSGTYGYISNSGEKPNKLDSIIEFSNHILSFWSLSN